MADVVVEVRFADVRQGALLLSKIFQHPSEFLTESLKSGGGQGLRDVPSAFRLGESDQLLIGGKKGAVSRPAKAK